MSPPVIKQKHYPTQELMIIFFMVALIVTAAGITLLVLSGTGLFKGWTCGGLSLGLILLVLGLGSASVSYPSREPVPLIPNQDY